MGTDTVWDSNALETREIIMSKAVHDALEMAENPTAEDMRVLLDAIRKELGEMREQARSGAEELQTLLDDMRKQQDEDVRAYTDAAASTDAATRMLDWPLMKLEWTFSWDSLKAFAHSMLPLRVVGLP